ncbi:MAG: hypothetical protein QXS66_07580 [Thermoproteota archaeon]
MKIEKMSAIFDGEKTVKDILNNVKEIDREIDSLFEKGSLHAIPFIPGVEFLLSKSFLKRQPIPQLLTTSYDYHILYFPQLGIIRSLRYKGEHELAPRQKFELSGMVFEADMLFEIKKLRLQRDEYSKLGKDLTGCFISYGEVNLEPLIYYKLPIMKLLYSNMIKPLTTIQGSFHSILPTPFSSTSIITINDNKEKLLTTCNLLLLIDYREAEEKFDYVLGEKLYFIESKAYAFTYKYDEKQTEVAKFQIVGPFRLIIPKIGQVNRELYEEYFNKKDVVISNVAAVIVMGDVNILLKIIKQNENGDKIDRGYILAFYEVPFSTLPDAFLHMGEPVFIWSDNHPPGYIKIGLNRNLLNVFQNAFFEKINYVKKEFNAKETKVLGSKTIGVIEEYAKMWIEQGWVEYSDKYLYLYAPSLVWLSIVFNVELSDIVYMLNEVISGKTSRKLIFDERGMINSKKLELKEKILESRKYLYIWNKVFDSQRKLIATHKLNMLI